MKVKILFIIFVSVLIIISVSQIFSIPPFAEDIFSVYKSGYFRELDRGFNVTIDAFINIIMMSRSAYGWIFLKDVGKKYDMDIRVYNYNGLEVPAPGETRAGNDDRVFKILNSMDPKSFSSIENGKYYSAVPVFLEKRCGFCHKTANKNNIAGIITFKRKYDAHIYYTSERMIIFAVISLVLIVLLYYIIRWEPGRMVKELFDKK